MGLGVLDAKEAVVSGTIRLFDIDETQAPGENTLHLKHSADGSVVLSPQPSDDPDDPLNWPRWRRDLIFSTITIASILSLLHGPLLGPVTLDLSTQYNKTVAEIAHLTAYMVLTVAICSYAFSILARAYGKRLLFLIAGAILVASDAWAGRAAEPSGTFNSMMGARVLSGVGQAMFEAVSLAVIADLYFVHERGKRVAIYLFVSQSGVTLCPTIATHIASRYGLNWMFYGIAISEAITLVTIFFFFWETAYPRDHAEPLVHEAEEKIISQSRGDQTSIKSSTNAVQVENTQLSVSLARKRRSAISRLNPWSGRVSKANLFVLTYRTMALNFHPIILWASISGLTLTWPAGVSYTLALSVQGPPYSWSNNATSNLYIAPWIGIMVAMFIGTTQDRFIEWMTRHNDDTYEPEFRLWYSIPATILFTLGYVGWGWGVQEHVSWVGLAFFFGFTYCGSLLSNTASISYIIDGYRIYAVECQVILFCQKNFFSFAMGYFFVPWYLSAGPKVEFGIIAAINVACALSGILVYVYGKKMRSFWDKHPFLGFDSMYA